MAKDAANTNATERVGAFEMRIAFGERPPESDERCARRVDALTAWLVEEWEREQVRETRMQ